MKYLTSFVAAVFQTGIRSFGYFVGLYAHVFVAFSPLSAQTLTPHRLLEEGRFVQALHRAKEIKAAARDAAASAEADYWLGRCYLALARVDSALVYMKSAFLALAGEQTPLRYEAENYLGLVLAAQRQYEEAWTHIQSVQHWCESEPAQSGDLFPQYWYVRGVWYLRQTIPQYESALAAFQRALDAQKGSVNTLTAQIKSQFGYIHWKSDKYDYERALSFFRQAEQILLKIGGAGNNYLAALYVNIGGCYDDMGYPRTALDSCYEKALRNFLSQDEKHPHLASVYNNTGNAYGALGEYAASVRYLEKAVQLNSGSGTYWNNCGDAYMRKGDWENAAFYFAESLKRHLAANKINAQEIARPYHNLAVIYRQKDSLDKALEYEFKSLPYRKAGGEASLDLARTYLGIGECFMAKKEFQTALRYLDTTLVIQHRVLPTGQHSEIVSAFAEKAKCVAALGDFPAAFTMIDSALWAGGYREGNFSEVIAPLEVLQALEIKGALQLGLYRITREERHVLESEAAYRAAAAAAARFRTTLLENDSKAVVSAQYRAILSGGIDVAYELSRLFPADPRHVQFAFSLAEQGRALLLLEGVHASGARQFGGITDSLLGRERALQRAIADTELKIKMTIAQKTVREPRLAGLKDELFRRQQDFEIFQRSLLADGYAEYYNARYSFELTTPAEVAERLLAPGQALLEYFVGDSSIFIFLVKKDDYRVVEVKKDFPLEEWVQQLRYGIYGYHTASDHTDALRDSCTSTYIESAMALYGKLLAPVDSLLPRRVVIVPDGALGYLPFEALLTGLPVRKDRFHEYPYFGRQIGRERSISYCYSATLLREMSQRRHRQQPAHEFLAYAPFIDGDTTLLASRFIDPSDPANCLPNLNYTKKEAEALHQLLGGKAVIGRSATKAELVREAEQYRIVHLATHGKANDKVGDHSFLAFFEIKDSLENEWLYVREIYNLALNADLVTLSACETGIGEMKRGEGIISLARAFAYAGAKSIVTSLWSVNDASTKDLMVFFYTNLQSGLPKDESLAQAKRQLMAQKPGSAHPYYWAAFVVIGDLTPI